jgi:hypothetical protein
MRASFLRCLVLAVILLGMAVWPIEAQQFQNGDVLLTTYTSVGVSDWTSKLLWYDASGHLKGQLLSVNDQFLEGVAFNSSGVLHVALGFGVSKVAANGTVTPFLPPLSLEHPVSLSFARDGGLYAGVTSDTDYSITHVGISGSPVARYSLPASAYFPQAVDLASDQCTLYYLTINTLSRFDVCHGTALADLATFPGGGVTAYDFRILPDHTLLVGLSSHLAQLNTAGQTLRQFGGGVFRMALDTDPRFLWAETSGGKFAKLDLATGTTVLGPFDTGMQSITSMTVFGEPRAALINGPLADIPALSPLLLVVLAGVLLGVGLRARW